MIYVSTSDQSKFWVDKIKRFPEIMSLFKSQHGHILCGVNFGCTKYSWSGHMYYSLSGCIFTLSKKVTDYL